MSRPKILGIGLSRTGTASLMEALEILGFSTVHYPSRLEQIEIHDAAADLPVADAFERLDVRFPGSKFIYAVRGRQPWLESCRRHWMQRQGTINELNRELRQRLYGTVDFDPRLFAEAYDRHEIRVLSYFAERPQDLQSLDICEGRADWKMLCSFLGEPVPKAPFPHTNRSESLHEVLLRLLHVVEEPEEVASMANVSIQYVEDLRNSEAFANHDRAAVLRCGGGYRIDRTLSRACSYFGDIDAAAAALRLPRTRLEEAIAAQPPRKPRGFSELATETSLAHEARSVQVMS